MVSYTGTAQVFVLNLYTLTDRSSGSSPLRKMNPNPVTRAIILGGGPAGLSAASELARQGYTPPVLEADEVLGGLARTVSYKGFLFDIGGHCFFTKSSMV